MARLIVVEAECEGLGRRAQLAQADEAGRDGGYFGDDRCFHRQTLISELLACIRHLYMRDFGVEGIRESGARGGQLANERLKDERTRAGDALPARLCLRLVFIGVSFSPLV